MDTNEMIEALIDEGYKKVTLYMNHVLTDDESAVQYFLTDEQGNLVGRNRRIPGCQGWVLIDWPVNPARCTSPVEIWEIDLTDREDAVLRLCMFY